MDRQKLQDALDIEGQELESRQLIHQAAQLFLDGKKQATPSNQEESAAPLSLRELVVQEALNCLKLWEQYPDHRRRMVQRWLDHAGWEGSYDDGKWKAGFCGAGASWCLSAGFVMVGWDSKTKDGYVEKSERTATPSYMKAWFEEQGLLFHPRDFDQARPGDLVFTDEAPVNGHVAVVIDVQNRGRYWELTTVDFNYSGQVKRVVWSQSRLKRIKGFGRFPSDVD